MKLILVAGARPNFMKVAPLVEELTRRRPKVEAAGKLNLSGSPASPLPGFRKRLVLLAALG